MTKLSSLGPAIIGQRQGGEPIREQDNFILCSVCCQQMDMRDFREVKYHAQQVHKPLELNS